MDRVASIAGGVVLAVLAALGLAWRWYAAARRSAQAPNPAKLPSFARHAMHDAEALIDGTRRRLDHAAAALTHEERVAALRDAATAVRVASAIIALLQARASAGVGADGSCAAIVDIVAQVFRGEGVPLDVRVRGDLAVEGADIDAVRVLQNLVANAIREAGAIPGGRVRIELADGAVRVSNPVRDPSRLDATIYEDGVSYTGGAGVGLAIAVAAASRVGWAVSHEVVAAGGTVEVAFTVRSRR